MTKDVTKRAELKVPEQRAQPEGAASRLKSELMADALDSMFGKAAEEPTAPGNPRVILALANHGSSPGWDYDKVLQREMFEAAVGSGLEMKFAFYGPDNEKGGAPRSDHEALDFGFRRHGQHYGPSRMQ